MYRINNYPTGERIQHERIDPVDHSPVVVAENNIEYECMRVALEIERLKAKGEDPLHLNAGVADSILKEKE